MNRTVGTAKVYIGQPFGPDKKYTQDTFELA